MDNVIIKDILDGNKDQFNLLIDKYYREIFKYVHNQFNDTELTKDICQDIFMKVFNNLKKFNPKKASFRTWLYRISSNYCINYRRDHFKIQTVDYDINRLKSEYEDVLEGIIKNEKVEYLLSIMKQTLNKKHYQIMMLFFFSDLSKEEIGNTFGLATKTIHNVVSLSIKKIQKEVGVNIDG